MTVLVNFLHTLRVGEPQAFENLTVFPLMGTQFQEPGYLLLGEALAYGLLEVREVSEAGSVNEVLVINKGDLPVLLMDGEILTGAKQNRVVNASILVAAHVALKIPVSCVEQGRWRYVAEKFTESRRFSYARLRAQKSAQVAESLQAFGAFSADQGAIWDEVERKQREMGAASPTGAVNSVYESHEEKLKKYCAAFSPLEGQVGAAVFINGRFVCLDAFDSPVTLHKLYTKMIESYALDALEQAGRDKKEPEKKTAERLLEKIAAARVARYPSVGLGEDLRIKTEGLVGSCLALDGRVIHLAIFAREDRETERRSGPLSRPSRRRRARL
ncbi:hypothetical protein SAMN02745218_01634 [Desulfofundulus australicus DSM 11792]|uniref:ARG and Rhodanese-Phosphatase-superfamily-associated domain-containing protein n=1 Tax=Desulfofundulus australicus DSM 11792 TaxID=1121425 RepID=A0A1M4ZKH5_9FIRM|nr:DUF6569 family protein [Desulfofundulus australicus]SHF18514.1 hypothetical protein SAMN02745218_01634 [Desulfofundulus australicus DSM 11792]